MIAVDARRALFACLIDHAPMFPPAQLPLDEALADHTAARASDEAWMVNRFVVRASQLAALPPGHPPRLSVVLDADVELDDPRVEAVELPPGTQGPRTAEEVYVELPPGAALPPDGFRAKIRCGGAAIPSVPELAAFVRECKRRSVPFKATAGLHHAVRTQTEHGLCNLLAAAVFPDEEAALAETEPEQFRLDADVFAWRDRKAAAPEIARVRRDLLVSVGSCSFTEPVDDLHALGLL